MTLCAATKEVVYIKQKLSAIGFSDFTSGPYTIYQKETIEVHTKWYKTIYTIQEENIAITLCVKFLIKPITAID